MDFLKACVGALPTRAFRWRPLICGMVAAGIYVQRTFYTGRECCMCLPFMNRLACNRPQMFCIAICPEFSGPSEPHREWGTFWPRSLVSSLHQSSNISEIISVRSGLAASDNLRRSCRACGPGTMAQKSRMMTQKSRWA